MDLEKLVNEYPNDMELGAKVREIYNNKKNYINSLDVNAKIFESPDGGKTVYERPFGSDISERTLVK